MKWTRKRPTKPGWYWAKAVKDTRGSSGPEIVSVDRIWKGGFTVSCTGDTFLFGFSDFYAWSDKPIKEPTGGTH